MEEEYKHKITRRCFIKEEIEVLGVKPLRRPLSGNRSLDNQLGYTNSKRPSKPNLPNAPEPSKLLLQQGFSEPCLV